MSLLLIIKRFIEAIIGINKEPWKYIYPIFIIITILVISVWNSYLKNLNTDILRVAIIIEGVFYSTLLAIGLIKKDIVTNQSLEKLIFFIPLYLYTTHIANIFLVLGFVYFLFTNFLFNKAGKTTANIFIVLNIFILSMFKFELVGLKTQGLLLIVVTLLISVAQRSKHFTSSSLLMLLFYSLQFLETAPKLIIGSSFVVLAIALKILIKEKIIHIEKFKEISIIEEIRIKIKTYLKNEEKALPLTTVLIENRELEKQVIEDKIYYLNTIKQAQALSLAVAIIGLLLSLYFVGNIL